MAASLWYCASKKFAEKTAWEIAESSNFTLSTICPPMVFGPPLHNVDSLDALNTSSGAVYGLMKKDGSSSKEVPETAFPAVSPKFMRRSIRSRAHRLDFADMTSDPACASRQFADVRNVAEAHFKSSIEGKNERYLVCNGTFTNQTIVDSIRDRYPDLKDRLAEGNRGEKPDGKVFTLDASKAEKELGLRCKS
jgi:nucleoside-diphosphate-sugar epimerase